MKRKEKEVVLSGAYRGDITFEGVLRPLAKAM